MTSIDKGAILKLEKNSSETFVDGVGILLRLLENVIREPGNAKFRTIRLGNKTIKEKLLSLSHIDNALKCIGFEKIGEELKLSSNILISNLKKYRDFLVERLNEHNKVATPANKSSIPNESAVPTSSNIPVHQQNVTNIPAVNTGAVRKTLPPQIIVQSSKSFAEKTSFPSVIPFKNNFLQHLEHTSDQVLQYEDEILQAIGQSLIPLDRLTTNALTKLRTIQKEIKTASPIDKNVLPTVTESCFTDLLLVELTNWFNTEFFTWINSMPCGKCGNEDIQQRGGFVDKGIRVETFTCCNKTLQFYRYNDVSILLKTRKGRCGEYANCFTFLCRCLGYDARLVYATFDHVWTEVYSTVQKRWLHIDPSDNVVDAPLMYQHGWKRNVDYVIGFSHDDIQDVTWRYSNTHEETKKNRTKCTEDELLQTLILIKSKRQQGCTEIRKKYLLKRALLELAELLTPKKVTDDELKGRSSGSLNWKLSRGEQNINTFYIFTALPEERLDKQFNIRYSCSKNRYERFVRTNDASKSNTIDNKDGWEACHFASTNIFRKHERDWKMVYLARVEGTAEASIEWKFNFDELTVKTISLRFETKTYENGIVNLLFLDKNGKTIDEIKNHAQFSIKAILSGGKGDCAWQHTQLFRQRSGANEEFPFEINITFY